MPDHEVDPRLVDLYDFFQNAPIGVQVLGADGRLRFANEATLELADEAAIEEVLHGFRDDHPLVNTRAEVRGRDGTPVEIVVNSSPRLEGSAFHSIRCCTYATIPTPPRETAPVTASADALAAMSAEDRGHLLEMLDDLFEHAPVGLHIVGPDGLVRRANRVELEGLGYTDDPEAYIGHHIQEFHAEQPVIDEMLERLITGRPLVHYPATILHRSGDARPVVIYSSPRFQDGEFVNTRCFTFPRPDDDAPQPRRFVWPRDEEEAPGEAEPANPMTEALKRLAGRRAAEESLGFLAEVSKTLAAASDHVRAVSDACELAVPFLADWCAVEIETDEGPDMIGVARAPGITGSDELVRASADGGATRPGASGVLRLPFETSGGTAGSVLLVRAAGRPGFGPSNVALAEELAHRVAAAVEIGLLRERHAAHA